MEKTDREILSRDEAMDDALSRALQLDLAGVMVVLPLWADEV